jgi:hypothetical protein
MATIKQDIKENFRDSMEQNTGIVGQVLKDRREKQQHDKEVAAELSEINIKTSRLSNDGSAFKKIELSTIQISENLQIINKWADAQVTTYEETHQALKQQQEEAAAATQSQKLAQPSITIPDPKEDGSIFDSILSLFGNLGKKIKVNFPKIPKGNVPKGKGKFNVVKEGVKRVAGFFGRNAAPIAKVGVAGAGVGALLYSGGLNTNEQEELERRRNLPPTITQKPVDYNIPPPTGAVEANVKTAAKAPDLEAAKIAIAQPLPPLPPSAPAGPPPVTATLPTPVATTVVSQGGGKSGTAPGRAPAAATPAPVATAPTPAAVGAPPPSATPASSSVPALSSVVKVKSDASIDGINSELAKRVATMAVAFKKETGKQLIINSGIRTNEEQKQLYDAKVAELKGDEKTARGVVAEPMAPLGQGKGSLHFKEKGGLALDIEPNYPDGLNKLAGTQKEPTGWLEKFGLIRPIQKYNKLKQRWEEDWHVQLASTPPVGDDGIVAGKGGVPVDLNSGKSLPIPVDPNSGAKLLDSSKTVEQLKKEQNARGTQTVVMTETTNVTEYERKKKPQGQTTAAVG